MLFHVELRSMSVVDDDDESAVRQDNTVDVVPRVAAWHFYDSDTSACVSNEMGQCGLRGVHRALFDATCRVDVPNTQFRGAYCLAFHQMKVQLPPAIAAAFTHMLPASSV